MDKRALLISSAAIFAVGSAAAMTGALSSTAPKADNAVTVVDAAPVTSASAASSAPATITSALASAPASATAAEPAPAATESTAAAAEDPVLIIGTHRSPVSKTELQSFIDYIPTLVPATDNIGNNWAQGKSGEATKAMGLVYEFSRKPAILDQMIRFCDAVLSQRNDLAPAPVGQHKMWTGSIEPVWPNDVSDGAGTGGEQGDPVGLLGNCARLILQTPSLSGTTVPIGDPHNYGKTYLDRAKKYVKEADYALDNHILNELLNLKKSGSVGRQYFSSANPYKSGDTVPWNQQVMFNYAFQNLAKAHEILGDSPTRVSQYNSYVTTSMNWLFKSGVRSFTTSKGNPAYEWAYAPPATTGEDNSHGSLDMAGVYRAYITNDYGVTADQMTRMSNIVMDVMRKGPSDYAGRLNGSTGTGNSKATAYLRPGYMFIALFRPNDYSLVLSEARMKENSTTTILDAYSRYLWVKNKRYGME